MARTSNTKPITILNEMDYKFKAPLEDDLKVTHCNGKDASDFDMMESIRRDCTNISDSEKNDTEAGDDDDEADINYKNEMVSWLFQLTQYDFRSETLEAAVLLFNQFYDLLEGRLALEDYDDYLTAAIACLIKAAKAIGKSSDCSEPDPLSYFKSFYPRVVKRRSRMTSIMKAYKCRLSKQPPRSVDFVPIIGCMIPFDILPDPIRTVVFDNAMASCELAECINDIATVERPSIVALCAIVHEVESIGQARSAPHVINADSIMEYLAEEMGLCDNDIPLTFSVLDTLTKGLRAIYAVAYGDDSASGGTKKRKETSEYGYERSTKKHRC